MNRRLTLKNIPLVLTEENGAVRVKSPDRNVLLPGQNIENVILIIEENFKIVDFFYLKRIEDNPITTFDPEDIHYLSISIVLYYLYMYNSWRVQHPARRKYQDLTFKQEDFDFPSTNDIIFRYCRSIYPADWEIKCSVLMSMESGDLRRYYEERLKFYNK